MTLYLFILGLRGSGRLPSPSQSVTEEVVGSLKSGGGFFPKTIGDSDSLGLKTGSSETDQTGVGPEKTVLFL